jgi:hypothetical protein
MVSETFISNVRLMMLAKSHAIEINECQERSALCEQICINTNGSYDCQCNDGYTLNNDGLTCSGEYNIIA